MGHHLVGTKLRFFEEDWGNHGDTRGDIPTKNPSEINCGIQSSEDMAKKRHVFLEQSLTFGKSSIYILILKFKYI